MHPEGEGYLAEESQALELDTGRYSTHNAFSFRSVLRERVMFSQMFGVCVYKRIRRSRIPRRKTKLFQRKQVHSSRLRLRLKWIRRSRIPRRKPKKEKINLRSLKTR
ncbi:hypothetical protein LG52_3886 [Geobacillus kaustophilus]|uniref:Uncharacterized protein n=1 Tax=Geobacillus kaustophilus TaxID=1462 RepID=A0A0D8C705_GEOKU|nr:hypothetical protein LG52_3886 [Geobacillus kaustophilus]